jgi:nucleotide-binding universal stress UspA family protein
MPGPIVVPLDRSAFAETALPLAIDLGARLQAPLQLTLVHSNLPTLPETALAGRDLDAEVLAGERAYLDQLARSIRTNTGVSAAPVILDGPIGATLIEHARARDARLVVMTTHGRGGVSRLFLGSVADRLIRELHCPVLLARSGHPLPLRPGDRRPILVPLDGSDFAESMIDRVLELFPREQLLLELVRVVHPARELIASSDAPLVSPTRTEERLLDATRYLHSVAVRLRKQGFAVHVETRVDRSVSRAILDYAEKHRCEMIALATHGLGGVERFMLGSVADKLVRSVRVPLLVWNPPVEVFDEVVARTSVYAEPQAALAGGGY